MYLSNKTLFDDRDIYVYNLLHKDQLHVSALDNDHLQVQIEKKLTKQLYSTYVYSSHKSSIAAY